MFEAGEDKCDTHRGHLDGIMRTKQDVGMDGIGNILSYITEGFAKRYRTVEDRYGVRRVISGLIHAGNILQLITAKATSNTEPHQEQVWDILHWVGLRSKDSGATPQR